MLYTDLGFACLTAEVRLHECPNQTILSWAAAAVRSTTMPGLCECRTKSHSDTASLTVGKIHSSPMSSSTLELSSFFMISVPGFANTI